MPSNVELKTQMEHCSTQQKTGNVIVLQYKNYCNELKNGFKISNQLKYGYLAQGYYWNTQAPFRYICELLSLFFTGSDFNHQVDCFLHYCVEPDFQIKPTQTKSSYYQYISWPSDEFRQHNGR